MRMRGQSMSYHVPYLVIFYPSVMETAMRYHVMKIFDQAFMNLFMLDDLG